MTRGQRTHSDMILYTPWNDDVGHFPLRVHVLSQLSQRSAKKKKGGKAYFLKVRLDKLEPLLDDALEIASPISLVAQYLRLVSKGQFTEGGRTTAVLLLDRQVSRSASQKIYVAAPS
jgi:hypothetical protein